LKKSRGDFLLAEKSLVFIIYQGSCTDVDYGDFDSINSVEDEDSAKSAAKALEMIDALRKKMIVGG
jgi:hypothetical protein